MGKQFARLIFPETHFPQGKQTCRNTTCFYQTAALALMKRIISTATLAVMALLIASGTAQTPANKDDEQVLTLAKEVHAQQAQIADNQGKIDTKLAELAEAIRVARIFAGRSGK